MKERLRRGQQDLDHIEAHGTIDGADPDLVSQFAMDRGKDQLGTLGSGNHFVEVGYVLEIYDETLAAALGLFKDQVTAIVHTGSRGLGHQVCERLHQGDAQGRGQVRHRAAGPAALLRPAHLTGGEAVPGGHGRRRPISPLPTGS